jgi:hypothetical protein
VRVAIDPAAAASASPSAMPASTSDGQWARRITRAMPTSVIMTSASTRTHAHARGGSEPAMSMTMPKKAAAAVE